MLDFELGQGKYTVTIEDLRAPESKESKRQIEHVNNKTKR